MVLEAWGQMGILPLWLCSTPNYFVLIGVDTVQLAWSLGALLFKLPPPPGLNLNIRHICPHYLFQKPDSLEHWFSVWMQIISKLFLKFGSKSDDVITRLDTSSNTNKFFHVVNFCATFNIFARNFLLNSFSNIPTIITTPSSLGEKVSSDLAL